MCWRRYRYRFILLEELKNCVPANIVVYLNEQKVTSLAFVNTQECLFFVCDYQNAGGECGKFSTLCYVRLKLKLLVNQMGVLISMFVSFASIQTI